MVTIDPDTRLDRLREFLAGHGRAFRRRDQLRWAALYLFGLLTADGRRNIESLARALTAAGLSTEQDLAQGLGHFLSQSPWDEATLWRDRAERAAGPGGVFVLEELTFVKQGRHSVGVHRQHSRTLGRKANCQLAVALYHVAARAELLGVRLYLPRAWLRDDERIDAAGVPAMHREPRDRSAIGLELLAAARAAGVSTPLVAPGPDWLWSEPALDELRAGGFVAADLPPEAAAALGSARRRLEELGLGHFEGRSWRGFHHHTCLVALAGAWTPS